MNIGEAVEQEEKLSEYIEAVREFTYLGDSVNVGGRCETAVITRTTCGLVINFIIFLAMATRF